MLQQREPNVSTLRNSMASATSDRSWAWGLGVTGVALVGYILTLAWALRAGNVMALIAAGAVNAFVAGVMFIIGHDAVHGILVPGRVSNAIIGRLVFLPSYHPYASWVHSHNIMHHGYTNLRGSDPVYVPFSPKEWRALPRWRQFAERFFRSPFGVGWFYAVTVWWPWEVWPTGERLAQTQRAGPFAFDRALVVVWALVSLALQLTLGATVNGWSEPIPFVLSRITLGVLWPFSVVMWLIGIVTYQQHTHPRAFWFEKREDWTVFRSQVCSTVEQSWGMPVNKLLLNVGHHHAHHVDARIPLYRLAQAQAALRAVHGEHMPHLHPRWSEYAALWRSCQLYDYRTHVWHSFDGQARTEPRSLDDIIAAVRKDGSLD